MLILDQIQDSEADIDAILGMLLQESCTRAYIAVWETLYACIWLQPACDCEAATFIGTTNVLQSDGEGCLCIFSSITKNACEP